MNIKVGHGQSNRVTHLDMYFYYCFVIAAIEFEYSTQLKNSLFDIIVQDNNDVMTTINARY